MPTIPKKPRTISQIIPSQLPEFVQEADPMFVLFLKSYYEWLETFGTPVWNGKVIATTINTITLTNEAAVAAQQAISQVSSSLSESINQVATYTNAYQNMYIVCLNGPEKGQTHKIAAYDPSTWIVTLVDSFGPNNIPPPNTLMEIRDAYSPEKLIEYRDIDFTLDRFIQYFRDEFMYLIPGTILANPREILKHIKQFYQARGTENSFRFIFRCLFNEEIELYYPKVDIFRASDAIWSVQNVIKTTTTDLTFDYLNRQLIGVYSGATASVESVQQTLLSEGIITTMTLSSVTGGFQIDPSTGLAEQVKIQYIVPPPQQTDLGSATDLLEPYTQVRYEQAYQLLQNLLITAPGENYQVGETIAITGGGAITPASAVITSVFLTYYTGSCGTPPSVYYLEPYFGPATAPINTDGNSMDDGVCIPGMYFFSDVHSSYTDADLLNPQEILLSSNEVSTDNFFVDDVISLVGGTGVNQQRTIVSYNGTTKVATVDTPWTVIPDSTTQYSITHNKGGILSIGVIDFGLGFLSTPTITIDTAEGSGAILTPALGIVAQTPGQWLQGSPGGVGGFPTTPDSFASSNKIIQDSYYWQDFSYDIRVGETIDKYRDVVKALVHPAGMIMFGTVVETNEPATNFLGVVRTNILQIENKLVRLRTPYDPALDSAWRTYVTYNNLSYSSLTTDQQSQLQAAYDLIEAALYEPWNVSSPGSVTYTIGLNTITPPVVGATNKDFDWMKFVAFPPNVEWNVLYPFPNQNYWSPSGPGNTQIANLANRTIGSFVNYPDQRTKIAPDANIQIEFPPSLVGPIGQSRATLSQFRFVGFPPFTGFDEVYPDPNENYWTIYGNTQIGNLKNIQLSDLITSPETIHSNFCVDSDFQIYVPGSIPLIGNQVEYNFLEGMNSQIVYNVSPNSIGEYDGVLGNSILIESIDGTWVSQGVQLNSSQNEIVNATGVPLNLSQCTVLVVARITNISANTSIVNCISSPSDNGFSIDILDGGAISYRVQYNNVTKAVKFPTGTVTNNDYFVVALRFENGKLTGNFNNTGQQSTTYPDYPAIPTINTSGWYFGRSTASYTPIAKSAAVNKQTLFGTNNFKQAAVSGSTTSIGYFDGTLVYAIFYDRALFDYEIDSAYDALQTIIAERQIATIQAQLGISRIQSITLKTLSGVSRITRAIANIQTGISRIAVTSEKTITGLSKITNTTLKTQIGVTKITNATNQVQFGISRIHVSTNKVQSGISRIQVSTPKIQTGIARITILSLMTQNGVSRIHVSTNKVQSGISRIQATTQKTQVGVSTIASNAVLMFAQYRRLQRLKKPATK